ncbi:MAG: HEPN domain-containing protein [archaeon]|nr:HEPN domain-containing protein [archaeon]
MRIILEEKLISWEKIDSTKEFIENSLKHAFRDLEVARKLFTIKDYDWALSISYTAMLQAAKSLMFFKGYRPTGYSKHLSIINFVKENFSSNIPETLFFLINKTRKKRHQVVYEEINLVSKDEAFFIIEQTEIFLNIVDDIIYKKKNKK